MSLEDAQERLVPHQQFRKGDTLVLSFQPREGRGAAALKDYRLVYELGEGAKGTLHAVRTSLTTGATPFAGRGFSPAPVARRTPMEWEEQPPTRAVGGSGQEGQEPPQEEQPRPRE